MGKKLFVSDETPRRKQPLQQFSVRKGRFQWSDVFNQPFLLEGKAGKFSMSLKIQ